VPSHRRPSPQGIEKPKLAPEFEEATEGEEIERKEKLNREWAQREAVVGSENRPPPLRDN
jgi:hypothetical protein